MGLSRNIDSYLVHFQYKWIFLFFLLARKIDCWTALCPKQTRCHQGLLTAETFPDSYDGAQWCCTTLKRSRPSCPAVTPGRQHGPALLLTRPQTSPCLRGAPVFGSGVGGSLLSAFISVSFATSPAGSSSSSSAPSARSLAASPLLF